MSAAKPYTTDPAELAKATLESVCLQTRDLIEAVPYRIHTVLTDNRWPGGHRSDLRSRRGQQAAKGIQFTARKQDIWDCQHIFDRVCDEPCSGLAAAPSGGSLRDAGKSCGSRRQPQPARAR